MNIRVTSTLTPDDENRMAPAVLRVLVAILDLLPIAYMIRIDTQDAQVHEHGSANLPREGEHASEASVLPMATEAPQVDRQDYGNSPFGSGRLSRPVRPAWGSAEHK